MRRFFGFLLILAVLLVVALSPSALRSYGNFLVESEEPVKADAAIVLAGDWTATGLPATIEGAIRSGETAGRLAGG